MTITKYEIALKSDQPITAEEILRDFISKSTDYFDGGKFLINVCVQDLSDGNFLHHMKALTEDELTLEVNNNE